MVVAVLVVLFVVLPIAELAVLVQVAERIGAWETLAVVVAVCIAGALLVRFEGIGVMRRLRATLERGDLPAREIVDGVLILFAGVLFLTPGFLTDILGIVLLIPPSRALVRLVVLRRFERRIRVAFDMPGAPGAAPFGFAGAPRVHTGPATYDVITTREVPQGGAGGESV